MKDFQRLLRPSESVSSHVTHVRPPPLNSSLLEGGEPDNFGDNVMTSMINLQIKLIHNCQGTKSGPSLDSPLKKLAKEDPNGQFRPSMHGTHCKVPFPMLMVPLMQPQSEMETDPKSRVLVPGGHILQKLPPS